jgi:hypothetical protein
MLAKKTSLWNNTTTHEETESESDDESDGLVSFENVDASHPDPLTQADNDPASSGATEAGED